MDELWQDLKYGIRTLAKSPGFTVVAVVALAIGIGANTAVFSVIDGTLFRPLPYDSPERLVSIFTVDPAGSDDRMGVSYGDFLDWQRQAQAFDDLATLSYWTFNLTGRDIPERILGIRASGNLFSVLGVQPLFGRTFTAQDDVPNTENVVVLSYGLWQRLFGGERSVVGRSITLNGLPHTVVGVMPPSFRFPDEDIELWGTLAGNVTESRIGRFLRTIGRLKKGVSLEQAQTDIALIVRQLEQQYPDTNSGWRAILVPLHAAVTGDIRSTLLVLLGAVGLVLLVACANVANLLLARAAARGKEIATRVALGAGSGRLARQHLTEAVLLSLGGGCLGLLGAYWGVEALKAMGPDGLPRLAEIHVDQRILAFSLGLSLLTGLLFGIAPALFISRTHPSTALRQGGRTTSMGSGRRSAQSILVVAQIALTLMLTIGSGLLIRTFEHLLEVDPGFHPDRLLTLNVFLTGHNYDTVPKQRALVRSALEKLRSLPGVASASVVSAVPFGETSSNLSFQITGREAPADQLPRADYRSIDPGYLRTMGIPLLRGRSLSKTDTDDTARVILINETMAQRFWPGEDPIGQSIHWVFQGRGTGAHTIVGVVGDVQSFGLDVEEQPAVYAPFAQRSFSWLRWKTFVLRTASKPLASARTARDAILAIDPDLPVYGIASMDQLMADSLAARRFIMLVLSLFAVLSLALASVGIYGVVSYGTQQRLPEFAVRMALGAKRLDILTMVIRRGLSLALLGIAIGLVGALSLSRHLETLLFHTEATDPMTFFAVSVIFITVALGACTFPATQATRVDPSQTLRQE